MSKRGSRNDKATLLFRLHRARLAIISLVLLGAGIVLFIVGTGKLVEEIAKNLITIGGISLLADFAARTIAEARFIELLKTTVPPLINGTYQELVDAMNRAPFQRYDAHVDVTLTAAPNCPDMYVALVRCEHRTNAPLGERVFLSSAGRYTHDYRARHNIIDYWTVEPAHGLAPNSSDTFSLLDYSANGEPHEITRIADEHEQRYIVTLHHVNAQPDQLYRETYTYRALVPRAAQSLRFTVDVPTHKFRIDVNHFDTNINRLDLHDFLAAATDPDITPSTAANPTPVSAHTDGWTAPASGVAITWNHNQQNA